MTLSQCGKAGQSARTVALLDSVAAGHSTELGTVRGAERFIERVGGRVVIIIRVALLEQC